MVSKGPLICKKCVVVVASSGNPRLQRGGGREGKWEKEKQGKGGGRGRGRKRVKGSPGNLLYTEHFSIEEQTPLARCQTEALV